MTEVNVLMIGHQGDAVKHNGLLGMNFLRNFQYQIDFQRQEIRWTPPGKNRQKQ
jgi:hypothetical protein